MTSLLAWSRFLKNWLASELNSMPEEEISKPLSEN
jgi:hypothetical protein